MKFHLSEVTADKYKSSFVTGIQHFSTSALLLSEPSFLSTPLEKQRTKNKTSSRSASPEDGMVSGVWVTEGGEFSALALKIRSYVDFWFVLNDHSGTCRAVVLKVWSRGPAASASAGIC